MESHRLYDRNFALAFASQLGFVLANTAVMAHYARWVAFLGGEVDSAGWISGTAFSAALVLRPWMGQWIDRVGARAMWMLGYALFIGGASSNLWLDGLGPAVYMCRAVLAVGAAVVFASSITYVSLLAPEHRRAEAIGSLGVAGFTGIVFGPYLAELLLSENRTRAEFDSMFSVAAWMLIPSVILLLFLKRPESEARRNSARLTEFLRIMRDHWPGSIVLVQTIFGLCMTVPFVFLSKFVDDAQLQDDGFSKASLFYMCYAGWGMTLRIASRRVPERLGRRKTLLAGSFAMCAGMLCFLLVDSAHPSRIVIPALLCGTGHSLMYHTCTALLLESFPTPMRGAGTALSMIAMDVGMISGSQILGEVAHRFGYNVLFVTVGVLVFASAAVYAIASIPVWQERLRAARG